MTEKNNNMQGNERNNMMHYDKQAFSRLIISDLSKSKGGNGLLKKYKQSEVREIIEGYKLERNQIKLREISQLLWAKSPQYQILINYFSTMALFSYVITPIKDIRKANKNKVFKQYTEIGELAKLMNFRHEMKKILDVAFREDVFYGYIHRDKKSFYIQQIDSSICKISSVEDGVYNYSIDMSFFKSRPEKLIELSDEIKIKFKEWELLKNRNSQINDWVELDAKKTICIKVNEHILEVFPPFAGSFDAIFDIEGFKQLRKDKEELGNYMILTQELPMRKEGENNNDFLIDKDMMVFFHNKAVDAVPDNVGVITSPMRIEPVKFDRDRVDSDGVAKAERDFWAGNGATVFNTDKSTSQGLLMSMKTDAQMLFATLTQIETWVNRYISYEFSELYFQVNILHITEYNQKEKFDMYIVAGERGFPVKNHIGAIIGLQPIETMNLAYLENDLLKMHEEFIPLMSSHQMSNDGATPEGRPPKKASEISDETARTKDKPNS